MLTLAEEIILLMLEDESGKFVHVPEHCVRYALSGAVLMELAFRGRIDTDPEKLIVMDRTPIGDDLLDGALESICAAKDQDDLKYWVDVVGRDHGNMRGILLQHLCDKGILREEENLFLWVFKSRRYPTQEGSVERREVKLRIMSLLFSEEIPEPRDVAIIGLADTCRIFEYLLARPERKRVRARIDQIRKLELIGRTVNSAVRQIDMQIARSMAMGPMC